MPVALILRLDPTSADAIDALQRALVNEGLAPAKPPHAPHLTLAVFPGLRPGQVEALREACGRWRRMAFSTAGLGVFATRPAVLWAAPVPTRELLARQAEVAAVAPTAEHSRPGAWVPHITLGEGLADPGAAMTAIVPLWAPVDGVLDRVEIVQFHPVTVLWQSTLAA